MQTQEAISGALAGLVGTLPMTIVMQALHNILPPHEQYDLPPEQIMREFEERSTGGQLPEPLHTSLTWTAHLGYGSAVGTIYALTADKLPFPTIVKGALYGLAVWGISYLGLLPALNVKRPATKQPARRNALMIIAHLVWGIATAFLVHKFYGLLSEEPPTFPMQHNPYAVNKPSEAANSIVR